MTSETNNNEDKAIDIFLEEVLGKVEPPDLQSEILTRLQLQPREPHARSIVAKEHHSGSQSRTAKGSRAAVWKGLLTAAIAASILVMIWRSGALLRSSPVDVGLINGEVTNVDPSPPGTGDDSQDSRNNKGRERDSQGKQLGLASTDNQPRSADSVSSIPQSGADAERPVPPRGIPLVIDGIGETTSSAPKTAETNLSPGAESVPEVNLVSQQLAARLVNYWSEVGIQPSEEATEDQITTRLSETLGIRFTNEVVTDPVRFKTELRRPEVAKEIADRWLRQITDGGLRRLDDQVREQLVDSLADCFRGTVSFDQQIADWINGTGAASAAFYGAMSNGGKHAMSRRLAALTMNVDLRCIRCHDAVLEGAGQQSDYWAFSALLSRGVTRNAEGEMVIDPKPNDRRPLFYELSDGRQRMAEPSLPETWLVSADKERIDSITKWSQQLIGSQAIARGTVNSLWQLVHGQPLHGRVVDSITAPHDEALEEIEDDLVQDMIRSGFDVSRTLSLIVASPATRRSVPAALRPENVVMASESEKRRALNAVNAFAASLPRHADLNLSQRLDQTMRAIGGKIDQEGRPFVAQIGDPAEKKGKQSVGGFDRPLATDFPVNDRTLPVQWLKLIKDDESQINHLAYLAGQDKLPKGVQSAVEAMREDQEVNKELMLNRVWWLVRP